jgi:hypothetical protein
MSGIKTRWRRKSEKLRRACKERENFKAFPHFFSELAPPRTVYP